MTQIELANVLGVSQVKVNNWESGYHKAKMDILFEIADVLGVTPAWLTGGCRRLMYDNELCEIVQTSVNQDSGVTYTLDHHKFGFIDVTILPESA
jgi:transcriptional regulator with XRE-family HTH domain